MEDGLQVVLMGMRFSGNRIWEAQINAKAEVKLTGKRGENCTYSQKKKNNDEKEVEEWKVKGREMLSWNKNQIRQQIELREKWKPIRNNVYKWSCCPAWSQGSVLLRLKPHFFTFLKGLSFSLLLQPLRVLEDSLLCAEIPPESSCVEPWFFSPHFRRCTLSQISPSIIHTHPISQGG